MRSFVNCVIVLTTILLFITPVIHSQTCPWQESGLSWWSIPSSWPSGSVPVAGQNVVIPSGVKMVYDVPPPGVVYGGINISSGAQLILSGKSSVTLSAPYILVQDSAALRIGSASCPYPYTANIVLYGPYDAVTSISGMGNKGILSMGLLDFYGNPPQPTWTRIAKTINVGATSFTVQDTLKNWNVGDTIVVTTTDYYQELSERFTIVAISGFNITVNKPAAFLHWGANGEFAEVAHISRNVRIQGDNSSDSSQFGGHVILKGNGIGHIYGVEFTKMGQAGFVGRYPFHFHIMGDQAGKGHFVSENSFHDTYQRCFTVHGTSGILARNNVGYNIVGHCYFFEEGSETNNYYDHNLGIYVTPGKLIPTDSRPAVFWITNPNNTFVNNAAAGGNFGFWFSLPQTPTGLTSYMTWILPRSTQLKQFDNNLAHSAQENGVHMDEGPAYSDGNTNIFVYLPLADSTNPSSSPVRTTFNNIIAYKNRGYGVWMRGSYLTLNNATMIDNAVGCNLVAYGNLVQNSLFVGETPNIGTPGRTDWFYDMGRSRPQIWFLYYPIHGFEFYDNTGAQFSRNNTFVNFTSDQYRDAGAFGAIQFGPYVLPATVVATQSTLINSNQWTIRANSFMNDGPTHVVVQDADGSLTGSYGSYIVSNNSILLYDNNCTMYSAWENFYLCQKNENAYSQIAVENLDVANTDFGNSTSMTYRAWYTPLGRPDVKDWITGGAVSSTLRYLYGANVISRRGYVLGFPHPTPYNLRLNMRYPASGEWVVLVLAYPRGTTFNLTRGYYNVAVTQVNSLSLLNKWTYYYDSNLQYLYTMYQEEDGLLNATAGFAQYDWGSDSLSIKASCGKLCIVAPNQPIPPALADNEDKYRAVLKGCYAGVSNKYEGTAYLNYNPISHILTYVVHHNIPQATFATFQSLTNGLVYDTLVAQSPIRGAFNVSWTRLNELWNGNWSMSIGTGTAVQLKGFFKCAGICSTPPMISSSDYCATIPGEAQVYTDSLNSTIGWMDWSYGVSRTFNYTGDKRCEQNSLMTVFQSYGALLFNVGLGNCAPGACTAYWMKPWVSMSTYSFFQFLIKSPSGPLNYPLFVTAQYTNQSFIGSIYLDPRYIDNGVIENSWTRVKVPIKDIGFVGNELIGTLGIQLRGYPPNPIPLLFDNMKLVPSYSDPLTKGPAGSAQSLTVTQC